MITHPIRGKEVVVTIAPAAGNRVETLCTGKVTGEMKLGEITYLVLDDGKTIIPVSRILMIEAYP